MTCPETSNNEERSPSNKKTQYHPPHPSVAFMFVEIPSTNKLPKETMIKSTMAAWVAASSGPAALTKARKKKKKASTSKKYPPYARNLTNPPNLRE